MTKRAVVMETPERKLHTLMQRVATIRNDKAEKRKESQASRKAELEKRLKKSGEGREEVRMVERFMSAFLIRVAERCSGIVRRRT